LSDTANTSTGYLHPAYTDALSEYGQPVFLPQCAGWVLERKIPGYAAVDVMGCYPLFLCRDWPSLHLDLEMIEREWITLALVADPFGDYSVDYLKECFPDVMIPFKQHYVVDLSRPARDFVIDNHARNARKALKRVTVEVCSDPLVLLDDWVNLYDVLIRRHQIRGITAFSRQSFTRQLQVPGLVAFRATAEGATVGMILWYVMGNIAYYHLGAYSDLGYNLGASFALFAYAIDFFADMELGWLNLGAGAGVGGDGTDGLTRFKRGWSTGARTAYFCGRIFDRGKYAEITRAKGISETNYFPMYRKGEFG
jgi:hypothetical protein